MLQTEEVDDDYFTPVASTSLANIFGNSRTAETQNESLKYTPPKPQDVAPSRPDTSKATHCLFASALIAYEWFNNTYTPRGKLGFAIIKILKTGICNFVLYDSNKTTLSCASISPKFEITLNETSSISYYDSSQKYWSVFASEEEIKKIEELLKTLYVNVKYSSHKDKDPPDPQSAGADQTGISIVDQDDNANKESDTDSSMNRRTKNSILNRMASMGHSVLPIHTKLTDKTSDSSDTNDSNNHIKTVRYKTCKSIVKRDRNTLEKDVTETHTIVDQHQTAVSLKKEQPTESSPLYTYVNGQLVPVTQTSIITNPNISNSSDMHIFLSEQRINNSELRINMNRMTDKVDMVLNKIHDLETKDKNVTNSDFQIQILQKLLGEYENKIKVYEDLLKSNGITDIKFTSNPIAAGLNRTSEIECLQDKIMTLEQINKEKCNEISKLQDDIIFSNKKISDEIHNKIIEVNELSNKIALLEDNLNIKDKELVKITTELEIKDGNIENKVKSIMNDTFRALSVNFENNENYAGDKIKMVIAAVIKKVTIDSLSG